LEPGRQAQTATTDTARGLSIRYADGRTSTLALRPRGGVMTAIFPRVDGAETAREGMSLNGLDVSHVVEGDAVVVTVSLMYRGGPNTNKLKVTTVRLVTGEPVQIDELRQYGVEPITLSIVPIPPAYAFVPRGISVSPYLDVRAAPIGASPAVYRVTVTNRSPVPLMWFRFEAYRGDKPPISARPRGKRDFPLVMPNAEHTFDLPVGSTGQSSGADPAEWQPLDRIEVTSLMWQDGVVEGDPETARQQETLDRQRSDHIRAVLKILSEGSSPVAALRGAISRTRPPDVEMRQMNDGLVEQLARFSQHPVAPDGLDFETWRGRTVRDLQQWLGRIVFPKP